MVKRRQQSQDNLEKTERTKASSAEERRRMRKSIARTEKQKAAQIKAQTKAAEHAQAEAEKEVQAEVAEQERREEQARAEAERKKQAQAQAKEEAEAEAAEEKLGQERRQRVHAFLATEYARVAIYVALTFTVLYVITRVINNLPQLMTLLTTGLSRLKSMLSPLLWGFVVAYLLYPVMQQFLRLYSKIPYYKKKEKQPRGLAVASVMILSIGLIVLMLSAGISAVSRQIRLINLDDLTGFVSGLASSLNNLYQQIQERLAEMNISSTELNNLIDSLTSYLGSWVSSLGSSLTSSLSNLTSIFSDLIFIIIFAIYFLIDTEGLERYWDKNLKAVCSRRVYRSVHQLIDDADRVFSGYIRGQVVDAVIMAVLVSIALSLVGVPYAVIIGILTGIGNLIPYVGPIIAYASTILVCLLNQDIKRLVISLVVVFIIQTIDGNVINPKLLSNAVHVHPMLVIIALVIGGSVGGILGMLVAVPVAALIKLWFDRFIDFTEKKKAERYASAEE